MSTVLVTNLLLLHYIEPNTWTAWHTWHIAALSYTKLSFTYILKRQVEGNLPQLRLYDVTGFIYAKNVTPSQSASPKTPTPIDCSSISSILWISYLKILTKRSWDTFKTLWTTIVISASQSLHLLRTPFSPRAILICSWDTWRYRARNIFPLPMYTSQQSALLRGKGGWMFHPN